jgi:hypothetical protein
MIIKKYIYNFGLLIFCIFIFNGFLNFYIVLNNNYQQRMLKYGGFCNNYGYGFVKYINDKYNFDHNIVVKNFNDIPSPYAYFFNVNKNVSKKYFILINPSSKDLNIYLLENNYKILEKKENCFLISFND